MAITDTPVTLGVVGGGQLGRMLAEAAAPLGVEVVVSDPTPECPASAVARDQVVGEFDDPGAVEALAERADCLTYEIELADPDLLKRVSGEYGVPVHPAPESLRVTGDKLEEKRRLREAGIPVPGFRAVEDRDDLAAAVEEFGYPVMLKARHGGYDGRGNFPVRSSEEADAAIDEVPGPALAEEWVEFDRELSVIGVRGEGEVRAFPAGENVHEAEILRETVVPARATDPVRDRAAEVARDVLSVMEGRGVFGIELFEAAGEILVNEIAPRPHNSGHYTIEGAHTSQFEQHVRAVLGYPLGDAGLRDPVAMANVLGDVEEPGPARLDGVDGVLAAPGAHLHWYGKRRVRPLRKMGHVTCIPTAGEDAEALLARARELTDTLTFTR